MTLRAMLSGRWIMLTLIVAGAAALCIRLGIWQLDRLSQRRAFNEHVNLMRSLPPLRLPSNEEVQTQEYRAAAATGTYDFEHQIAIRNQVHDGQYGFHLLTPLRFDDASNIRGGQGEAILIDRGWIPAQGNQDPQNWRTYDQSNPAVAKGVVRLGQSTVAFGNQTEPALPRAAEETPFWLLVDIGQISKQLPYPILPVYLQLDGSQNSDAKPIAALTEVDLSEGPHRGYAIQWFVFSALLLAGYPLYVRRHERGTT